MNYIRLTVSDLIEMQSIITKKSCIIMFETTPINKKAIPIISRISYSLFDGVKKDVLLTIIDVLRDKKLKCEHIILITSKNTIEILKEYLRLIKLYNPQNNYFEYIQNNSTQFSTLIKNELDNINHKFYKIYLKNDLNEVPEDQGIYFLYSNKNELLYIGRTNNLFKRLSNHINGTTNTYKIHHLFSGFTFIKYSNICNKKLDLIETCFINTLCPIFNINKTLSYDTQINNNFYIDHYHEFIDLNHFLRYKYEKNFISKFVNTDKFLEEKKNEINSLKELLI